MTWKQKRGMRGIKQRIINTEVQKKEPAKQNHKKKMEVYQN